MKNKAVKGITLGCIVALMFACNSKKEEPSGANPDPRAHSPSDHSRSRHVHRRDVPGAGEIFGQTVSRPLGVSGICLPPVNWAKYDGASLRRRSESP